MKPILSQALNDTLDYLRTLAQEKIAPAEAKAKLASLRSRYPEMPLELLWEEQAFDRSLHYDALLTVEGEGTVSLSFCPERALPWPARGVHRWDEQTLLRVNRTFLKVDEAVACLDFIWDQAPVIKRLVNRCLVQEELERHQISLTAEELQEAMDAFRRTHRLYKAEDTVRWLERRGITQEKLEGLVGGEAAVAKLRDQVTSGEIENYFQQNRADFARASVVQISCANANEAEAALEEIRTGRMNFYAAAEAKLLSAGQRNERNGGSQPQFFSIWRRGDMEKETGEAVFSASPGEIIGPVRVREAFSIVRVLAIEEPRLDEATREAIKKILFDKWLEQRRTQASVEWYWGNAKQTAS